MSDQRVTPTLLLSVAALLIGAGVFYHFVTEGPRREKEHLRLQEEWKKNLEQCEGEAILRLGEVLKMIQGPSGRSPTGDELRAALEQHDQNLAECLKKFPPPR